MADCISDPPPTFVTRSQHLPVFFGQGHKIGTIRDGGASSMPRHVAACGSVRRYTSIVLAVLLALGSTAPSYATENTSEEDSNAAANVVARAMEAYQNLKTYQDAYTFETIIAGSDVDGKPFTQKDLVAATLAFESPDRIALHQSREFIIQSNGTNTWTAMPSCLQFRKQPADKQLNLRSMLPAFMTGTTMLHPAALVLARPDLDFYDHFPFVQRWIRVEPHRLNGRPGQRVVGEILNPHFEVFATPRRFEAWFSDEDGLLRQVTVDLTEFVRHHAESGAFNLPKRIDHAGLVIKLENITTNVDIEKERFVFSPGIYDSEVERFTPQIDLERSMMNRPAPSFSGKDINGETISLANLRGRVVLLDFWSIGCGPCIVAMPSVQQLANQFANQPVSIIGVNSDPPQYRNQVKMLLENKGVRFQQFMDPDNVVQRAYFITGVPCTYVIDQQGITRYVHLGLTRDFKDRTARIIESLLSPER